MLNAQPLQVNAQCAMLNAQPLQVNAQCAMLNAQPNQSWALGILAEH
jgi:hypothetical protein